MHLLVANRATRTLSAEFTDSKGSTCVRRGHQRGACKSAGQTQRVEGGDIPEASQDETDVGEVWAMMAETEPETSCSAGSETSCSDGNRVRTFATTLEYFDENHPAQELTFMCSDTGARSSMRTAASYRLTTCMTLGNTATANNARSRTALCEANLSANSSETAHKSGHPCEGSDTFTHVTWIGSIWTV